jgi:hypothetical protein
LLGESYAFHRHSPAISFVTDGDFRADAPSALFATGLDSEGLGISGRNQYVVTGDGTRFLLNEPRPHAPPAPITVVINWMATLER